MRRSILVLSVVCLLAWAAPVGAQVQSSSDAVAIAPSTSERGAGGAPAAAQQPGTVSRVYLLEVKAGMVAEWEAAAAEHVAWHREQADPWPWIAFYVETGKNTGKYGWVTSGHEWADFDTYDATIGPADNENAVATHGQYTESYTSSLSVTLPDFSNPAPEGSMFPLYNIIHYTVDPTKEATFVATIAKAHSALQEGGFDGNYAWSVQVSGGEGLVFTLVLPLEGWADMAPPERTIDQIFEEVLGAQEGQQIMTDFAAAIVSSESWIGRILPDLSYTPGQ